MFNSLCRGVSVTTNNTLVCEQIKRRLGLMLAVSFLAVDFMINCGVDVSYGEPVSDIGLSGKVCY